MVIQSGAYNKLATFYTIPSVINSFGGCEKGEKEEVFRSYVYMSNLRNSEYWENHRATDKNKLRIRVRFTPKMLEVDTKKDFVEIDGEYWNILSIENVYNRNREYLLYLEKRLS